jgi:3-methyladenine DNA glycosylase AlkD
MALSIIHLIVDKIRQELEANADEKTKNSTRRFLKENVTVYGVKTAVVLRKIAHAKAYCPCFRES